MGRKNPKNRKPKTATKIPVKAPPAAISSSSAPPAEATSSAVPLPPWIELPRDVTANILQKLGAEEILKSAEYVCTTWWKVCHDPAMWRVVDLKNPCDKDYLGSGLRSKFELMCRCAVDRSQGQLTDLSITRFGEDDLLYYVADRSSNLRRFSVVNAFGIKGMALAEAVQKLSKLEELHLIMVPWLFANNIETIGISCPMLRSFTFSQYVSIYVPYSEKHNDPNDEGTFYNAYGYAIGKTMPNLLRLRVTSHMMKNKGLEAILDGCPLLESLDIRQCYALDLRGALGKRCSKQIKDLRLPSDPIGEHEWPIKPSGIYAKRSASP